MRIHCPACEAECDAIGATASQSRCGTCGLLFTPNITTYRPGPVPPPPSVIYSRFEPHDGRPTAADIPPAATPPLAEFDEPPQPTITGVAEPLSAAEPPMEPLGPPPPYRPIEPTLKTAPRPVEMAPPPPTVPVNVRGMGMLGPPPPYRPIIQAAPTFGRGPPPDLEPWRLASMTRVPSSAREPGPTLADIGDPESEWSLIRDPTSEGNADTDWDHTRPVPGAAPSGGLRSRAVPFLIAGPDLSSAPLRKHGPVLWAVAIMAIVAVIGTALAVGRDTVMWTFPGTTRLYAVIGLRSSQPSAAEYRASLLAAKCAERRQATQAGQPDDQNLDCEGSDPAPTTK